MAAHRKLTDLLNDGREVIYFDDLSTKLGATRAKDARNLSARPSVANMRLESLTGDWVSVAAHRNGRAFLPPANQCPLCPTSPDNPSEMPDQFDVAVFENKNPSFGPDTLSADALDYGLVSGLELGSIKDSIGRCEVIVFSPEHLGSMGQMPTERVRTVVEAWADRTIELQKLPGVRQVFPFENRGEEIGVTLHHPHGQIYAYPFVTPRTKKLMSALSEFGPDLFEKTLEFERKSSRVLLEGEHFTAYVPFAARWPLEIHMLPNRHINHFGQLTDSEKFELSEIYPRLLRSLDMIYESPTPYIAAWHQAPLIPGGENVRLQLQITSPRRAANKLKYLAASESAMGAFIADIEPEAAAAVLREALSK